MTIKVLYCSSGALGHELCDWLNKIDVEIVGIHNFDVPITTYPDDYDLGVSFLYTHRIPADHVAKYQWINFHPGPLPEMRGRNLAYYAIMNSMKEFGATLHYMDANFDTGPIIEVRRFPILDTYTAGDLVNLAHKELENMFKIYLPRFANRETIPAKAQQYEPIPGTYYRKNKIEDLVTLQPSQEKRVRALTVPGRYYARVEIGGQSYRLVSEVEL